MNIQLPKHIAIIMDGNGRWAQMRHEPRASGHRAGAKAAKDIVTACRKLGISYLTLYTFSQENWNRPKEEIAILFGLLVEFLKEEVPNMIKQSIRLNILGNIEELPFATKIAINHALKSTKDCSAMVVNLALNYSGRNEILDATKALINDGLSADQITEESFRQRLYTKEMPDPDLIIRTSGEIRISNYLLFQCAYSEFYFTKILWPDFTPQCLQDAIEDYAKRQRRFGKTQEQL